MNKKKIMIGCIITGVIIIVGLIFFLIVPLNHENECKRKEHQELKEKIEDVKKSVVGIISKKDSGDGRYHIEMESGIIFEKKIILIMQFFHLPTLKKKIKLTRYLQ